MASTYTDLGIELMATGENAGTWGTKTNNNLTLIEQLTGGVLQNLSIAGGAGTTALTVTDGDLAGTAQQRVIEFSGTISGNRIVTFPVLTENFYIIKNGTSGAHTVQLKAASGSGATVTFSTTEKGYKIIYLDGVATNTGVYDITSGLNVGDLTVNGDLDVDGNTTITTADNSDTLTLGSTDADADSGPNLRLYRNSGSPANDDIVGRIDFEGRNNNSQDVIYANMQSEIMSVADGSEDGQLQFGVMKGGTLRNALMLDRVETVFNENSVDIDFRVESNGNANMLFVDGGNDKVGIGTSTPSEALDVVGNANLTSSVNHPTLEIRSTITPTGSTVGGRLKLSLGSGSNSGSGNADTQAGDKLGSILFNGQGTDFSYQGASIEALVTTGDGNDVRANQGVAMTFGTKTVGGSGFTEKMRLSAEGNLGIGTSSPSRTLSVFASTPILALQNSTTGQSTSDGFQLQLAADDAYIWNYESGGHTIFGTNNTERMRILSDGKVGIGTTTPGFDLVVKDASGAATIRAENGADNKIVDLIADSTGGLLRTIGSYPLVLNTDQTERMRIAADGPVSIASSNVTQNAHLNVRQDSNGHAIRTYMSATVGSGALSSIKYIRAIPVVSSGTQLIIPFIAQNNINSKTYVHVRGMSCEANTRAPKAFECKFAVGHTSNLNNLAVLETLGTCTGASISSMNIVLAFNTDYTHSGDSGMFIELDYIAHHQDASINLSGIVMN